MDLNWCTVCDRHIQNPNDAVLYCSRACKRKETSRTESSPGVPRIGQSRRIKELGRRASQEIFAKKQTVQ